MKCLSASLGGGLIAVALVMAAISTAAYGDQIDDLFSDLEGMLSRPDGGKLVARRANEISEKLVDAFKGEDHGRVEKAAFLMRYADPTEGFDEVVAEALSSGDDLKIRSAISILGTHGLLGENSKDALIQLIDETTSNQFFSDAARIAGRDSVDEVIPILQRELMRDDIERNTGAALALVEFGPSAREAITTLEAKLQELQANGKGTSGEESYISKLPIPNRRKHLLGLIEKAIVSISSDESGPRRQEVELKQQPAASPPMPGTSAATPSVAPEEPKPSRWPLVLAGVAAFGILLLLIRVFLRGRAS